jgi:hypothetical protein
VQKRDRYEWRHQEQHAQQQHEHEQQKDQEAENKYGLEGPKDEQSQGDAYSKQQN